MIYQLHLEKLNRPKIYPIKKFFWTKNKIIEFNSIMELRWNRNLIQLISSSSSFSKRVKSFKKQLRNNLLLLLLLLCLESYPNSNIESDISSRNSNYIYDIEQILHYASKVLLNNHLFSSDVFPNELKLN